MSRSPGTPASISTSRGKSRRTSGSPPVSRSSSTPSEANTRTSRSISSNDSRALRSSHGRPSAGMQYWQRKLQRSVTETRRSEMRRPCPSISGSRVTQRAYPLRVERPPEPRIPKPIQFLLIWYRTIPFLERCRRKLGDTFAVHTPPFGRLVYIADPADIKRVFTGDPAQFHAGDANAFVMEPVLGKHSLLVLDEEEHLAERKLLLPHFHGESVRRYAETMASVAAEEVDSWRVGDRVAMRPAMQRIGLEVILRAVIGVSDPGRLARLRDLLPRTTGLTPLIQAMWLWPWLGPFGPRKRYRRTLAATDAVLYEEIAARREDPAGDDILSLLVANSSLTDAQLRDELMTLLIAGHETTATGLAWAFERLVRNPAALERAAAGDDDYLDAVVKETLRVRPVVADVVRAVTREAEVGGYCIPAGTVVLPAVALVQRAARNFGADALAFRPE